MADSVLVELVALGSTSPLPSQKKKNFKEEGPEKGFEKNWASVGEYEG